MRVLIFDEEGVEVVNVKLAPLLEKNRMFVSRRFEAKPKDAFRLQVQLSTRKAVLYEEMFYIPGLQGI